MQYSTVQLIAVLYSAVQCIIVQCSAVQCCAIECSVVHSCAAPPREGVDWIVMLSINRRTVPLAGIREQKYNSETVKYFNAGIGKQNHSVILQHEHNTTVYKCNNGKVKE